ncbi:MAG: hypothetical protein B6D68_02895 [spirochete symbiont of Stewartia floridana]|nr:MAG: hypothetical protein B6D68_02895 [spirochete symbiont of Stewartia floridana]
MQPIIFEKTKFNRDDFHLDVNLELPGGKLSVILGPSGSGKTTLLDICAGFLQVDAGRILFGGKDITRLPPQRRNLGFVFQDYALFGHLTVMDNVAFGPRMRGCSRGDARRIARKKLAMVGLEEPAERRPDSLSGGERQRVSLARALAADPGVLLLDEPFSSLDAALRLKLRREVRRIIDASGVTALLVTHDQEEALALADYLAIMNNGSIVRHGPPAELWSNPQNHFTAAFLGQKSWLHIKAFTFDGQNAITSAGQVRLSGEACGVRLPAVIMIRPQYLKVSPYGPLRGRLVSREFSAAGWRLELMPESPGVNRLEAEQLTALWPDDTPPRIGEVMAFDVDPHGVRIIELLRNS